MSSATLPSMTDEEFSHRIAQLKTSVRERRDRCIALGKAFLGVAFTDAGHEFSLASLAPDAGHEIVGAWTAKLGLMTEKA